MSKYDCTINVKNLPKRSLGMFCLYIILTISYLRAQTIETSSLPTDSSRPLFKQIENFSILTVWLYISTVSTFLNIRSSYLSASSGFRLLGEIPAGAIISCFYVTLSWKELMALLDSQAKFQKERNCQESVVSHVRELRQLFKKSKLWKGRTQSCCNSSFLKS